MKVDEIRNEIREIHEKLSNHLVHVAQDISEIRNDLSWVKRFFWLIAGATVSSIFGVIVSLLKN